MIKKSMKSLFYTVLLVAGLFTVACRSPMSDKTDDGGSNGFAGGGNADDGNAIAYYMCDNTSSHSRETVKMCFYSDETLKIRYTSLDDDDYMQRYDYVLGTYKGDPTKDGDIVINFEKVVAWDLQTYVSTGQLQQTYETYSGEPDVDVKIKDGEFSIQFNHSGSSSFHYSTMRFYRTDAKDLGPYQYYGVSRRDNDTHRTEWTVPEGYTSIADGGFHSSDNRLKYLKKITLPSTIKKIGDSAFYNCVGLEEINIPSGCKIIDRNAFFNCISLKEITIPKGIEQIGSSVFGKGSSNYYSNDDEEEKPSILVLKFEDGITEIPENLFSSSSSYSSSKTIIKKVVIPSTCKKIGKNAFYNLVIPEVEIPSGVEEIGDYAFYLYDASYASEIENFTLPSTVKTVGEYAFYNNKIKKLVLSEGLESIGRYAFYCYWRTSDSEKSLEVLELPASLKEVKSPAFYLTNLKNLKYADTLPNLQNLKIGIYSGSSITSTIYCNGEDVTEFYKDGSVSSNLCSYYDSYTWKNDSIELVLNSDKTYSLKNASSTETGYFITKKQGSENSYDSETGTIIFYPVTGKKKTKVYSYNKVYENEESIYTLDITGWDTLTKE